MLFSFLFWFSTREETSPPVLPQLSIKYSNMANGQQLEMSSQILQEELNYFFLGFFLQTTYLRNPLGEICNLNSVFLHLQSDSSLLCRCELGQAWLGLGAFRLSFQPSL